VVSAWDRPTVLSSVSQGQFLTVAPRTHRYQATAYCSICYIALRSVERRSGALQMRVSSSPVKVGEKQDDHESASGLELLEEPGQDIAKNKTFYSS
jgi:hypothetical protein